MKRIALLIYFLLTFLSAMSQTSGKDWVSGYLVQMNNDTLHGELLFDWKLNTLSIKNKKNVKVFSGRQMYYFEFDKCAKSRNRKFYVLPYALNSDYETPTIFELLVEGELSLLARTRIERRATAGSSFIFTDQIFVRDYYFIKNGQRLRYFSGKKHEILDIMADCDESVGDFMQDQKIKLKKEQSLIKLTEYYNSSRCSAIN